MERSIRDAQDEIEHILAPYGQYLAMKGARPNEQFFGMAEVGLAALSLVAWGIIQYLKSILAELGKKHAESLTKSQESQAKNLEVVINKLETLNNNLELRYTALESELGRVILVIQGLEIKLLDFQIRKQEVENELKTIGLTRRVAEKTSAGVSSALSRIFKGTGSC